VQEQITHAENFSLVMHGAALFYNLMLAEKSEWEEKINEYHTSLDEWWAELRGHDQQLACWDRERFWVIARESNSRIPNRTEQFANGWLDRALNAESVGDIFDSQDARASISDREFSLKRGRARLHDPRALENWKGQAGTARVDYRWASAQDVINDILEADER
jgi:hypothetical protein